ncbi:MAG: MFS transporter [Chitinivibrionales bacterium]|nr:MFS transporter [Chitinivibrionales bacterium]
MTAPSNGTSPGTAARDKQATTRAHDDATNTRRTDRRAVAGWILYDWANSAFALSVMAAFFPVFFKRYWCAGYDVSFSTIRLNLGNAVAGVCIAILAPVLGALADAGRKRKRFLLLFMLVGTTMSAALALVEQGAWQTALAVFVVANIGFSGANLFYDSLLPSVAPPGKMDIVSSAGYGLGYLGCALLFIVNMLMLAKPAMFGLADRAVATKAVFVSVAVWWLIFSIPLAFWVREPGADKPLEAGRTVARGLRNLRHTFRDIFARRTLWLFLVAYWLYIDGVHTFIRAAADLGLSIGIAETALLPSLLVVQLVAFPSAYVFGLFAQRFGALRCLLVGIFIYLFVTLVGPLTVQTKLQFGFFAALSALPLGALQALSRSYYARLVPPEKSAEYFGFYSLMGKFAVMLGPATVAAVAALSRALGASPASSARFGCASLSFFFVAGGVLLIIVDRLSPHRSGSEPAGP